MDDLQARPDRTVRDTGRSGRSMGVPAGHPADARLGQEIPKMRRAMRAVVLGGALIGSAAAVLATASACGLVTHRPGGNMRSNDRHVYESTPYEPYTLELMDLRTGEAMWKVDVPVGRKAVIAFYPGRIDDAGSGYPDMMRWEIYDTKQGVNTLRSAIAVPPAHLRRIDVSLRDIPEFPPDDFEPPQD